MNNSSNLTVTELDKHHPIILRENERTFLQDFLTLEYHHFIWGAPESGKTNLVTQAIKRLPATGYKHARVCLLQQSATGSLLDWYISVCIEVANLLDVDIEQVWIQR